MSYPTLSVVMSNYNHGHFLHESVQSVLDQSFQPCEFIITDDASTDNSVEILRDFETKYPIIRLITNHTNRGGLYNIERANELAKGHYIYSAAADDQILPGFFETSLNLLAQYPQAGLCSSLTWTMDEQGNNKTLFQTPLVSNTPCYLTPAKARSLLLSHGAWIMGTGVVYRRDALAAMGGFPQALMAYADAFVAELIALKYGACFLPEVLSIFRVLENSLSGQFNCDFDAYLTIFRRANSLRRTTYADLYPVEFQNQLEWNRLYWTVKWRWDIHNKAFFSDIDKIYGDDPAALPFAQALKKSVSYSNSLVFKVFPRYPKLAVRVGKCLLYLKRRLALIIQKLA